MTPGLFLEDTTSSATLSRGVCTYSYNPCAGDLISHCCFQTINLLSLAITLASFEAHAFHSLISSILPAPKVTEDFGIFDLRHDTIKLLEENISKTFSDINCSTIFSGQFPKAKEIKAKINKWDLVKPISFCIAKETINKMKRQPMGWEKIFANDATDKGLISKIYKQPIQLNIKKTNNLI